MMSETSDVDPMTGAASRASFLRRLDAEVRRAVAEWQPLSVLMVDVDDCGKYNHDFGHAAGDEVIEVLARLLQAEVGTADAVARYGGEVFAVLLPSMNRHRAKDLAERVQGVIVKNSWMHRPVTVSIGVASSTPPTIHADDLVRDADEALYRAKSAGRNRIAG